MTMYTISVVHVVAVVFIAAVYLFAFRFWRDRLYIPLALGWLLNACHLSLEAYLSYQGGDSRANVILQMSAVVLGISSIPCFQVAVQMSEPRKTPSIRWRWPLLLGLLSALLSVIGAMWGEANANNPFDWVFAIVVFPAAVYSLWVLFDVAECFYRFFPEDDYGYNSRILYGSWGLYAILQFFYPFKLFSGLLELLPLLFLFAFAAKVLGSFGLLNVLQESYTAAEAQLREASVLADLGNVAAGLHHDIANPLSEIGVHIHSLEQKRNTDPIVKQVIEKIRRPLRQIQSAIEFVNLVRQGADEVEKNLRRTNARNAVALAISGFRRGYPNSKLRAVLDEGYGARAEGTKPPALYVRANEDLLVQAFFNVIKNAWEAEARVLRVRLRRSHVEGNVDIVFVNDGQLLTEEQLENCFKAGWSTREQTDWRANIGMGLYMARKIVMMHRGTIKIGNLPDGSGVELLISLPAARQAR